MDEFERLVSAVSVRFMGSKAYDSIEDAVTDALTLVSDEELLAILVAHPAWIREPLDKSYTVPVSMLEDIVAVKVAEAFYAS